MPAARAHDRCRITTQVADRSFEHRLIDFLAFSQARRPRSPSAGHVGALEGIRLQDASHPNVLSRVAPRTRSEPLPRLDRL